MVKIMKVTRLILFLLIVETCCFCVPLTISAQTETFDIVQFTPPKGWTRTPKDGAVAFIDINKANGFCLLTIFKSSPSLGTPQKDFTNEWNGLLVKPFKAAPNPKTQTQDTPEGWH